MKSVVRRPFRLGLFILSITLIAGVLLVWGIPRVKLYNEYQFSLRGTENFSYDVSTYDVEPQDSTFTVDQQLFFSLDEGYQLLNESDHGAEYQWKDEEKYIAINFITYSSESSIIGGVSGINGSTTLSEEKMDSIMMENEIYNSTDLLISAIEHFEEEKATFFSSTKKLEEGIFFNSLIQDIISLDYGVEKIEGNVRGLRYFDTTDVAIAHNNKSYIIFFMGDFSKEEIERFLKGLMIKE